MNKPTLYIMCGLSGSGKSTIATQIVENTKMLLITIILKENNVQRRLQDNKI